MNCCNSTEMLRSLCGDYRLPLWSSDQSSWLQIQMSGVDFRHYRFSEKYCVWNGFHSASRVQFRSHLKEKVAAPV
jgi:hypothetical protein